MAARKFSCESRAVIPLPPEYSFAQAFNYLNAEKNSFYILERDCGNYIQCGGSKTSCCVETRVYQEDASYQHSVIGHISGSDAPTAIQMSAGVVNVLKREVLSHWEAIELFKRFFAGEPFPDEYSARVVER
jgi:hypothetical protein